MWFFEKLGVEGWILAVAALTAGLSIGFVSLGLTRRRLERERDAVRQEFEQHQERDREHSRTATRLRSSLDSLLRELPNAMQAINRESLDSRNIPKMIARLASSLFGPRQLLLYLARDAEGNRPQELQLVLHQGLGEVPESLARVPFGNGRIGWVAEHRVEMVPDDWANPARTGGTPPVANHPAARLDIVSPILRFAGDRIETLGVLCLGDPGLRPADEKRMLQMVNNLGAIALTHARNLKHLKSRANHDGLTGLMNKLHFMEQLAYLINNAERLLKPIGVFIFDIDHFKQYNDANGHPAGDTLLRKMASVLTSSLRPGDIACRYGGEEFVVAMPETDGPTALGVAERIREAIEHTAFANCESQPLGRVTISGGVAAFPVDGTNGTELISHADQALYRAKAASRNRVFRYEGIHIGTLDDSEVDDALAGEPISGEPGMAWDP